MDKPLKISLKPCGLIETECESVELEILEPASEMDAQLAEIDEKIANLSIETDKLTSHTDKLDYAVAVASGVLTGLIDALFVGETEYDIEKVRKELEKKYHTPHDSAYQHRIVKDDGKTGWISSTQYHRFEDLAHHPTILGLLASILSRFFRIAIFCKGSGKNINIFFTDPKSSIQTQKEEAADMYMAWGLAILSGVGAWVVSVAKSKGVLDKNIPAPLRKVIEAVVAMPAIIELLISVDKWLGHIMSDVSTTQGIGGSIISNINELFTLIPGLNKLGLADKVKKCYASKSMNLLKGSGVIFSAAKHQMLPVVINEALVRCFYFLRHLITEYKQSNGFENINWGNVIPFGNRTVERMITVASGTFTAVDTLDALIKGAIHSGGTLAGFGKQVFLRLNFVGIGRFAIALGTDVVMGLSKDAKDRKTMLLKAEALYLMDAKLYHGETLVWSAAKDANESVDKLLEAMRGISFEIADGARSVSDSVETIKALDTESIEKNNEGLTSELLEIL